MSNLVTIDAPIFIIGAGRSGTTLLRTALAAHPRIAVPPETHYMKRADEHGAASRAVPDDFTAFWERLTDWSRFHDLAISRDRVLELASAAGRPGFREVFAAMLAAYGEAAGKPRVGEKTPGHYLYWRRILDWFPDARLIVVRRDPRAVTASALSTPWVGDQMRPQARLAPFVRRGRAYHVAAQARGWRRIYGNHVPEALRDPRVTMVGYEDLVTDPETALRAICAHVGEDYDPAMLARRTEVRGAVASAQKTGEWEGWVARHEAKAAREISDTGLSRWRDVLGPAEQAVIEAVCGPVMERWGYGVETSARQRRWHGTIARGLMAADGAEIGCRAALRRTAEKTLQARQAARS